MEKYEKDEEIELDLNELSTIPEGCAEEELAICSDIDAWKKKKAVEEANAKYNELLYYGIGGGEE